MWEETVPVRAGDVLTRIGFDHAATRRVVAPRLAAWADDDQHHDRPVVFGVRTVKVGWRRHRLALVHEGLRVRARLDTVEEAADHLASILAGLDAPSTPGRVTVRGRVLTDGAAAVVWLPSPSATEPDDRPLIEAGVVEAPVWRAAVDPRARTVDIGGPLVPIRGLVVSDPMAGQSIDGSRRHLWAMAEGPALDAWTDLLDARADLIDRVDADHAVSAILARLAPSGA